MNYDARFYYFAFTCRYLYGGAAGRADFVRA